MARYLIVAKVEEEPMLSWRATVVKGVRWTRGVSARGKTREEAVFALKVVLEFLWPDHHFRVET